MKSSTLTKWEHATQDLANEFVEYYFDGPVDDSYWVGQEIGGAYSVADYWFSFWDMVEFMKYHYGKDKMFEYYNYRLDLGMKGDELPINIKNYKKLKKCK